MMGVTLIIHRILGRNLCAQDPWAESASTDTGEVDETGEGKTDGSRSI